MCRNELSQLLCWSSICSVLAVLTEVSAVSDGVDFNTSLHVPNRRSAQTISNRNAPKSGVRRRRPQSCVSLGPSALCPLPSETPSALLCHFPSPSVMSIGSTLVTQLAIDLFIYFQNISLIFIEDIWHRFCYYLSIIQLMVVRKPLSSHCLTVHLNGYAVPRMWSVINVLINLVTCVVRLCTLGIAVPLRHLHDMLW